MWWQSSPPAGPPSPPAEPAGAIPLWDARDKLPQAEGVRWEDDSVRLDKADLSSGPECRDAILRLKLRSHPQAKEVGMQLRSQSSDGEQECYQVALSSDRKRLKLVALRPGVVSPPLLGEWPLPAAAGPDEWLSLELSVRGEEITVSADGQFLGTVHDASVSGPGRARVFASAGGFFRDTVYIPLGPQVR